MTTYTRPQQPDEPWTAERLTKLLSDLPPDPLNGATTLHVHPDNMKLAARIKEASGGRLHIQLSKHASTNVIAGFKGEECVAIIRLEKK
jgi:hypothetical protein